MISIDKTNDFNNYSCQNPVIDLGRQENQLFKIKVQDCHLFCKESKILIQKMYQNVRLQWNIIKWIKYDVMCVNVWQTDTKYLINNMKQFCTLNNIT